MYFKLGHTENYDVAVIGAGHAGIEAGLSSARLGCNTIVFAINLDSVEIAHAILQSEERLKGILCVK